MLTNGDKLLSWDGDYSAVTGDTVVSAVWSEPPHTVIFNAAGGTLVSGSLRQTVPYGEAAAAPELTNGVKVLTWDADFSAVTEDMFVNAVWEYPEYTVTFDPDGGTLVSGALVQTVEYGRAARAPVVEKKDPYGRVMQLSWDRDFGDVREDETVRAVWTKRPMTTVELAEYADSRTVTVFASGTGTGFFIDDDGTLVTNYHVISYSDAIRIETLEGKSYDVVKVVDFSDVHDIAILQADVRGNDYFPLSTETYKGESVYAVGSSMGTLTGSFTGGVISSNYRKLGLLECLQIDASITGGNSGGPLLNVYGDVIGITSYTYIQYSDAHLAIRISALDALKRQRNYTVAEYAAYWTERTSQTYRAVCWDDLGTSWGTFLDTYETVTGEPCSKTFTDFYYRSNTRYGSWTPGYDRTGLAFRYNYTEDGFAKYVDYLTSLGFESKDFALPCDEKPALADWFASGDHHVYTNYVTQVHVAFYISPDKETVDVAIVSYK